jgi:hypothetical protein
MTIPRYLTLIFLLDAPLLVGHIWPDFPLVGALFGACHGLFLIFLYNWYLKR